VIRTSDNTVTDTLTGFSGASAVAFSPDGTRAYVVNTSNNTVSVINTSTKTVSGTLTGFSTPNAVAVSSTDVYVVNQGTNTVSVIGASG
jgi:YVTN family beta-propeller protein